MNGYRKILTTLSALVFKAKNNPDFAAAVFIGYGLMTLQIVVQVFLLPLYYQTFGAYRFGALMILIGCIGFAFALVGSIYSVLLRLFGEAQKSRDSRDLSALYIVAKALAVVLGVISGLSIVGVELVHPILFEDAPADLRQEIINALLLSILHLLLICEISVDQAVLASRGRQAASNLITFVGLLVFAASIVPALSFGAKLTDVIACFIAGDIVSRLLALYLMRQTVRIRWREPIQQYAKALRRILASRARSYLAFTTVSVGLQMDVLIIGAVGGPLAAAKFVLVWKIAEVLVLILSRVTQHLQVEFVRMDLRGERERLIRIYHDVYRGLFAAAFCLGIMYGFSGHWIVSLWVGEEAVPSEPWAYALAGLGILWLGISRPPTVLALSLDRITPLVWLVVAEFTAKLVLIVVLVPHVGYLAPVMAISIVHVCGVAYGYFALGRSTVTHMDRTQER